MAEQPDTVRSRPGGRSALVRERALRSAREIIEAGGYDALSHNRVAERSGVDRSTVYRRWPTRAALAVDALLSTSAPVAVPDLGSLPADLSALVDGIADRLADPDVRRAMLTHALALQEQPELQELGRRYWAQQLHGSAVVIRRAQGRGEVAVDLDGGCLIERALAPLLVRALHSGAPIDDDMRSRCVEDALELAGATQHGRAAGSPGES